MLGIQHVRLLAGDPEEVGVEAGHVPQIPAPPGFRAGRGLRTLRRLRVCPACGELPHRVACVHEQPPQGCGRIDIAGKPAPHAHDGDL